MQEEKSKSQIKQEMTALQKLGERLLEINEVQLARLQLPATLLEAVALAKRIKHHEGRRRQLQYIGKLMRKMDAEPIRIYFEQLDAQLELHTRAFHDLENWRDRLIVEEGNGALTEFLDQYPNADRQTLRHLIQKAKKAKDNQKIADSRALFRFIREVVSNSL